MQVKNCDVANAIDLFSTLSAWKKLDDNTYVRYILGEKECHLVMLDTETYLWRKLKNTLDPIREDELLPEGRTLINLYIFNHHYSH